MSNLLVRLFGWRGALYHGNTTVLDRWRHLRSRLPRVRGTGERVLDVGCGTGAFTMGIASRGYEAVGLSWDERNQTTAMDRAKLSGLSSISFPICDARKLGSETNLASAFDIVVCFEVIEHIIDDRKLMRDIYGCLKPGGRLHLTTPNYYYRSSKFDMGPFQKTEEGWHVRRGYSEAMLRELCDDAGLVVEDVTHVSFMISQLVTRLQTRLGFGRLHLLGGPIHWLITLPLRIAAAALDPWLGRLLSSIFGWPGYAIALTAYKPRFGALQKSLYRTATDRQSAA